MGELVTEARAALPSEGTVGLAYDGRPAASLNATIAEAMMSGVANRLDADGRDICVPPEVARKLGGDHRACPAEPAPDVTLLVRVEETAGDDPEGFASMAVLDPLTPDERTELDRLVAVVGATLTSVGPAGGRGAPWRYEGVGDPA